MKYNVLLILLIGSFILFACEKEEPEIAGVDELSIRTLSEGFISQPVTNENSIVGIVNNNDQYYLCSYSALGEKNWQQSIQNYAIAGTDFSTVEYLGLQSDLSGQFVIGMCQPEYNNQQLINQNISVVKFSSSGQFLWRMNDTIHQPDTVIIGTDTIDVTGNDPFEAVGFVPLSDGSTDVVSYHVARNIDSTFIQLSNYSSSGQFSDNQYLKINGLFSIHNVYVTSNDNLFLLTSDNSGTNQFKMINLNGDLLFQLSSPLSVAIIYFFYENTQGNYLVSVASSSGASQGQVICISNSGAILWTLNPQISSGAAFMLSVNQQSGGYLFSGVSPVSGLFDWRNSLSDRYHAVLLKTDLSGAQLWDNVLINEFNSAGAGTIGDNNFSYFLGKNDGPINNIIMLKYDQDGKIIN